MTREKLFSVTKKDFRIDTFRSGGKGGQNQNKRDTGVRITHIASDAVGEARDSRSQAKNREEALKRLLETPKWKVWFNRKVYETLTQETIEQKVEKTLVPKNLYIENRENGIWVESL